MRGIRFVTLLLLVAISATCGCIFKPQPFKGVISYKDGKVFIRNKKYYTVGLLPDGWENFNTRARTISFYNKQYKASISTDAYCGKSVGDRALDSLSGGIITALEGRNVVEEGHFTLDDRGALRQKITGTVDGVATDVDIVIVRKDECVFDFYSVSQPGSADGVKADFETFFKGFHY